MVSREGSIRLPLNISEGLADVVHVAAHRRQHAPQRARCAESSRLPDPQ
jgi:hypothetical protein